MVGEEEELESAPLTSQEGNSPLGEEDELESAPPTLTSQEGNSSLNEEDDLEAAPLTSQEGNSSLGEEDNLEAASLTSQEGNSPLELLGDSAHGKQQRECRMLLMQAVASVVFVHIAYKLPESVMIRDKDEPAFLSNPVPFQKTQAGDVILDSTLNEPLIDPQVDSEYPPVSANNIPTQ